MRTVLDPFARLPPDAIAASFLEAGWSDDFADGWVHEKVAAATIVAVARRGRYEVHNGGRRTVTEEGEAFLAQDGEPLRIFHHARKRAETMGAHWLHGRFTLFRTLDLISLLALPTKLNASLTKPFGEIILELLQMQDGKSRLRSVALSARKSELAFRVVRLLAQTAPLNRTGTALLQQAERLAPVLSFIDSHLAEPLTSHDLARAAHMSRSHFFSFFQKHMGRSPMDYLKEARLAEARNRLLAGDAKLSVVSESTGFASSFHFSREFKRRFGVSPNDFRKRQRLMDV
jgi:AraC-like DNA-binding protein